MHAESSRKLGIEGWRGVSHSFCLVNQLQILELMKVPELQIFHRDAPFALKTWSRANNGSGFSDGDQASIDALADFDSAQVDCLYRIASPFKAPEAKSPKTVTFMVTELGLDGGSFTEGNASLDPFTADGNLIVTPSSWSRDRLADYGFAADRLHVVPHGVDTHIFQPAGPELRAHFRRTLGIGEDEILFFNVGLPTWNKGLDLVLKAFSTLRSQGRPVRLILKDQKSLYGLSIQPLIATVAKEWPALNDERTLSAISTVSHNLSREELSALYNAADCYVSPYRAEGFNLPVLEAIACGTPVIVTKGGATDDFCTDDVATRIDGAFSGLPLRDGAPGRFIEPNLEQLTEAMAHVTARRSHNPVSEASRQSVLAQFTWQQAARQLQALTVGS